MAITNGYSTLNEAKTWIGLNDYQDDSLIEDVVESVSRWIDNYCKRHFWQATATARVFDACDGLTVDFGEFGDLVSVTSVKTDDNNDGVYETTWAAGDYQLLPRNAAAAPEARPYRELRGTGTRTFPLQQTLSRSGLIEVTGTWGWAAVPNAVRQACRMQVSRILKRKQSPEGVSGWGEFGPMRISGRLDPDVQALLWDYRLTVIAVA